MKRPIQKQNSQSANVQKLFSIYSTGGKQDGRYIHHEDISFVENLQVNEILKELLLRRTHFLEFRCSSIIYDYLQPHLDKENPCTDLSPNEIKEKSKNAFWSAFSFFIGQDFIEEYFFEHSHLFEERGVIHDMAFAHSYKKYLQTINSDDIPY